MSEPQKELLSVMRGYAQIAMDDGERPRITGGELLSLCEALSVLKGEKQQAEANLLRFNSWQHDSWPNPRAEAAEAELETLREALRKHGRHTRECPVRDVVIYEGPRPLCI